jgi:hypothetical protein
MELVVVLALVVLIPIALLLWRRRDDWSGERGNDGQANRDLGRHGGPPVSSHEQNDWGGTGSNL